MALKIMLTIIRTDKFDAIKEYCINLINILGTPQDDPYKAMEKYVSTLPSEVKEDMENVGFFLIEACSEPVNHATGEGAIMYLSKEEALRDIKNEIFTTIYY